MLPIAAGRGDGCALLLLAFFSAWVVGCSPDAFLSGSEERDRNFQRARDAEMLRDFEGAAEHYERALDRNPKMANAHLGYAALCEGPLGRYADAVYHYQRYLRLRPGDPRADDIRRRVTNCTERLATSVPLVVRSEVIARDLEATRKENLALRTQVAQAVANTAFWSNEVRRLASGAVSPPATPEPRRSGSAPAGVADRGGSRSEARGARADPGSGATGVGRTHRVQRGDTLMGLSRRYGVSLQAIRQANPGVEERRLLPNTVLRIPDR